MLRVLDAAAGLRLQELVVVLVPLLVAALVRGLWVVLGLHDTKTLCQRQYRCRRGSSVWAYRQQTAHQAAVLQVYRRLLQCHWYSAHDLHST